VTPSCLAGRTLRSLPAVRSMAAFFYLSLPAGIMLVNRAEPGRNRGVGWLKQLFVAGVLGAIGYWIVPAVGPHVAFAGYPESPGAVVGSALTEFSPDFPRNCVPSLHFGWALLAWLNARGAFSRALAALISAF